MALSIGGYVLDPVRVGGSNSPFTFTPDNYVRTPFPTAETVPRAEYLVQVLSESAGIGTGPGGKIVLADATFGWTKNEGALQGGIQVPFQRFDYADQDQRFRTLVGGPREVLGTLSTASNVTRLVATPPQLQDLASFPIRVSVGTGSGITLTSVLVTGVFGAPAAGTVEIDVTTGQLNWSAADLTAFGGQSVYFQRQAFYSSKESDGVIGTIGVAPLLLSPLPATGQIPSLSFGARGYLTTVERGNESAFSADPAAGTVEWARTTGRLKLSSNDLVTFAGESLVYAGVFLGTFKVPRQTLGLAQGTPAGTLSILAPEGSDLHFRISGVVQFPKTVFVDTFVAGTRGQVQVRRSDGAVQLSAQDRIEYSGKTVEAISSDASMDRGVVLRLFRSIVNDDGANSAVKDVTAVYSVVGATLADPIIGQPFVSLPALPLKDRSLLVTVEQGTGAFTGTLPDLGGSNPPQGKGYLLNLEDRQLSYAERKNLQVLASPATDFAAVQLPDAPVYASSLRVELEGTPGAGDYAVLTENQDFVVDLGSGVLTFTETRGESRVKGTAVVSGSTLTASESLFDVAPWDSVVISSGIAMGVYTVLAVPSTHTLTVSPSFPGSTASAPYEVLIGREVLVDRFFREIPPVDPNTTVERLVSLGPLSNGPRLSINAGLASRSRFRFGKMTFSAITSVVSVFTAPGSLLRGTVEIDRVTGELNFSQDDITTGGDVYWSRRLQLGTECTIQPGLGFIEFADRMLEREEVYLRYVALDDAGNEATVQERGAFLVSKEVTLPHPTPVSTLTFNVEGREVAVSPAPSAFRGGRPQKGSRVTFDVEASTLTFLPDTQVTDALPHGAVVAPEETVYVDYYVYEAIGGESTLTVARTPMALVRVDIASETSNEDPLTSFQIKGDRTADFPADHLLRVARSEVYLLAAPTFDGTVTTVNLAQAPPQALRSDASNPVLEVTSGPLRRVPVGSSPSYLIPEVKAYDTIARGSKQIRIQSDLTRAYVAGTIICLTDLLTLQQLIRVEASTYSAATDRTTVTLSAGVSKQHATSILLRSVRPVLDAATGAISTANPPLLNLPFTVYHRTEGEPGKVLTRGDEYTLDESGLFTFSEPLGLNEEIAIFYTGATIIDVGRRVRASYTFVFVPSIENGLQDQVLKLAYSTYIPDTFFYRIETMTNFRGELIERFEAEAKANSPSQGPILENSGSAALFEKGSPSLFFNERDLANQDLVARPTLVYYNTMINDLEDWLQDWDGRVVGDHDGRFQFDGLIDNPVRSTFASATNQIDDPIRMFGTRTRAAFEAATYSRFYPTQRARFGAAANPFGLASGDPILDLGETTLRHVASVRNRAPWASVTVAAPAGTTVFQVDHAQGDPALLRPGLNAAASMKVAIVDRDGTVIVSDASPAAIASTTDTSVTLTAPVTGAVPQGATIRLASTDTAYAKAYALGFDVGVDLDNGFVTHIENTDVPVPLRPNTSPPLDRALDVLCQVGAVNTDPERFPALDGGTTDDDGDRQLPSLAFDPRAEILGINRELDLIKTTTGTLRSITSNPLATTGTLTSSTVLSRGAAWPAPIPKVGDLVRLRTSLAGTSYYHRVASVGATDLTVEPRFQADSGAITFDLTRGNARVTSTTGSLTTSTVLTDASGNYIVNGVRPGHTVVVTAGTFIGQRRQVQSIGSATQLTVSSAFSGSGAVAGYQVVDSLGTFGGPGSLQTDWEADVADELRALEGQDFIDFADLLVQEVTGSSTITVNAVVMGAFDALVVFLEVEDTLGNLTVASATFNGSPLNLGSSVASSPLGLFTYWQSGLSGATGNLSFTVAATSPNLKLFAVKLSSIKAPLVFATATTTAAGTLSTTSEAREAGDLVLSMACSSAASNSQYPIEDHNTLIPLFSGAGCSATMRATRASAGKQSVTSQFVVGGTSRMSTVLVSKDMTKDVMAGRPRSEKAALEAFFDLVLPDRGLGDLVGAITSPTTITGNFANVAAGDVLYLRHGPNAGVYTIDVANGTSVTVVEGFAASPESNVVFRAGDLRIPEISVLQKVFTVLKNVESAIVNGGLLAIQQHCPILVYRNGTASGTLPGTTDSSFTSVSGRLTLSGARARPIASPTARATFLGARAIAGYQTVLEGVLTQDGLYDGRYTWIDGRINLETGILPKRRRAMENRQKALQRILANLTKLLTV